MIDYRDLLKRYVQLIIDCEGVDFITSAQISESPSMNPTPDYHCPQRANPKFTQEEVDELNNLASWPGNKWWNDDT